MLGFDLVACLLYRLSPNLLDPINRLSLHGRRRPAVFFAVMLAVTAAFYIPGRIHFGPASWFEFGPFSVQHGRVLLYATYFFFGAGIGVANLDRGLLAADGRMAKVSWDWMVLTIVPYCLLWVLIYIKREILGNPSPLPTGMRRIYALCFAVFSVAIMFLILAFFLRFRQSGSSVLDPMQADAYGMFLVHYPIALWLQYWLFDYDLPAIVKAAIGFVLTVALSWALTRALRQIPGRDEGAVSSLSPSLRGAQRRSNPFSRQAAKWICFASLAMTWRERDLRRLAAHIGRQPAFERRLSVPTATGVSPATAIASPPVVPMRAQGTPAPFIFASTRPASAAGTVTM